MTCLSDMIDRQMIHLILSEEEIALLYELLATKEKRVHVAMSQIDQGRATSTRKTRENQLILERIEYIREQLTDQ
jgi:hypothetical protein